MRDYEKRMLVADEMYQRAVDYSVLYRQRWPDYLLVQLAARHVGLEPYELRSYLKKRYPLSTHAEIRRRWRKNSEERESA